MEEKVDIVREKAKERLASMDREALGDKSIEAVKNIYNKFVEEEYINQVKENSIREMAQEKLSSIDRETLNEMSIEEVKNTYNDIKEQIAEEYDNKRSDLENMFKEEATNDSVKTK